MRYLLFFFLFFFSHFSFSQAQSVPNCQSVVNVACTNSQYLAQSLNECKTFASHKIPILGAPGISNPPPCNGSFNILYSCGKDCSCPDGKSLVNGVCSCPAGTQWDQYPSGGGTCLPITCPEGQIKNTVQTPQGNISSCIDEPEDNGGSGCDESEKVYDPVSGTFVCPGSGDGDSSSSASSQTCVVPGDYDGDCIVDSQQGSSINNSNPASSPNTSSPNTSSPSTGGGDDDGENPSTGGGGGGGGGSTGGASAGSASSAAFNSGSWNPYSGYGNWIPIATDSPCPNKYVDVSGQWWCAGNGTFNGSASSAASNNSNSSGSNSSGSNSSGSSSSCPAKPQCSKNTGVESDDEQCKDLLQEYFRACPSAAIENGLFDIEKDESSEGEPLSFGNSLADFKAELIELETVQQLQNFFQFNGSGSCPVWQVSVWVFDVVIDQQCSPDIPWDLIAGVIIAVSVLLAARIALT